ncbi:MAG: hypothetical protein L7H10_01165 [Vulcanisaeta sp.]|jgi:hypothetical protein|nr:hypothetical protein [Vulcanisaeta sp.]MCG2869338.1 hypothetical protein [Vulcanisaeta sp.]MCG2886887.1 hypothetical protein [Vulcanisaeta sp.]MCG2894980.1 hypothetical protein [Vulcanisaeta sp.]
MGCRVVVITEEWDYFRDELESLCAELDRRGIECRILDLRNDESTRLIIKYGIENGIVRIPQIYVISDGDVKRIRYEVTKNVRLNLESLINHIMSSEVCGRE